VERFERLTGEEQRAARRLRWFLAALTVAAALVIVAALT
jgi:hypothetical protein